MTQPVQQLPPDVAPLLDGFWSTEHAARFCDCSPDKIQRWVKDGILAGYDIGERGRTQLRVSKAEVVALMRRRRVSSGEPASAATSRKPAGPKYRGRYLGKKH